MWMFTRISIAAALLLSALQVSAITPDDLAKAATAEKKPAATDSEWLTNMEIAMAQAKKENKDILIDFTGSDWCGWCKKLDAEVFTKPAFKKQAPEMFVLVKLDFPQTIPQPENIKEYNRKWMEKFGVRGFPTIILTDAEGNRYAQTGYQQGGAEKYIAHLKEIRAQAKERKELLAKAAAMKGAEKAKTLDKALSDLDDNQLFTMYPAEVDMIISLDADNALGLKNKYSMKKTLIEIQELMRPDTAEEAKKKIEQVIKDLKPQGEDMQKLMMLKANVCMFTGDKEGAKASFQSALKAAPKSELAPQIQQILELYFSPVAERLIEINEMAKDPSNQEGIKKALVEIDKTEKEMKLNPEQRQQLFALKGEILLKKGDKKEAKAAFEAALKAAPDSRASRRIRYTIDSM
jgi:thioredoxin-related protein/predicted negative regulator of RcsB-dependent stress response